MKTLMRLCALLIVATMCATLLIGCSSNTLDGSVTQLSFWVIGSNEELTLYKTMTDEFNNTYGKENNIHVNISQKPNDGYVSQLQLYATSNSGPDVFFVAEDSFKAWVNAGMLADMTEYLQAASEKIDISDIYDSAIERWRYDVETNTSNADDPWYALPLDSKPSALYYNEFFFTDMGITVISVDEENMDRWNNNEIPDNRGKYKSDYPALDGVTVPKKGYYRSENPYVDDGWQDWSVPTDTEILVFNNRIPMNWDELEDLARLFTPIYNPAAAKYVGDDGYGFFAECWFSYGWSVGGDCLTDLSGNGDWNFSLLDYTANYIVADGQTYVGKYSGTTYKAGETLTLQDKLAIDQGKYLVPDNVGGYHEKSNVNDALSEGELNGEGALGVRQDVIDARDAGTLVELPSTREAFTRYLKLGASQQADIEGEGGLDISPNPNVFSNRSRSNYFFSGKLAMLVEQSTMLLGVAEQMTDRGWVFDVAPLSVYKEYEDPHDPDCDTVVARGKPSGESNSRAMAVRGKSKNKAEAAEFIVWMASRNGQTIAAEQGFFPNQADLASQIQFRDGVARNAIVFAESMEFARPGDWWYMKDFEWILVWSTPLNSNVRNGLMSYGDWKAEAIRDANDRLKSY